MAAEDITSPILWQSAEQTTVLLDIPRSITHAQGTVQNPCHDILGSAPALEAPFITNEPKSEKARAQLGSNTVDQQLHGEYSRLLQKAVSEIRETHVGSWCLPRPFTNEERGRKRKQRDEGRDYSVPPREAARKSVTVPRAVQIQQGPDGSSWSTQDLTPGLSIHGEGLISNDSEDQLACWMSMRHKPNASGYHIPPNASFYVGDCSSSQNFRAAVRAYAEEKNAKRTFDFILLDPPWPNRSVKRTHQTANSTYHIASDLNSISDLLFGMDLDMLMDKEALIGIWVTNKPAIRELVLGENGLFATWGVQLTEEWIWLKTTTHGEPATPLDAMWRKPYEVLLLGKRQQQAPQAVKRRVIVAVPDLHSRKPCLKVLIEPLLLGSDHKILEVFARHLVAGWTSWGDECIEFNNKKYWRLPEDQEHQPS